MKKAGIIFTLVAATIGFSFAGDNACGEYEQFTNGAVFTVTSYNAKGKLESTVTSKVNNVSTSGTMTKADVHAVIKDSKDKETTQADYTVSCDGGEVKMDMKAFATAATAQQSKDMQMSFEGNTLNYPKNMTVGQSLGDATMKVNISSNGSLVMVTTINIKDRKVVAKESKTTSAGTWECFKITYTEEIGSVMTSMNMSIPIKPRQVTEWYSFKVGAVRSEFYKNEKLESYNELTAFSKP